MVKINFLLLFTVWNFLFIPNCYGKGDPYSVAVIISNKTYHKGIPEVRWARNDGNAVEFFVRDILGVQEENIIHRTNATQSMFTELFGSTETHKGEIWNRLSEPGKKYNIFVYFSGHGVPSQTNKKGYLLPSDANPDSPESTGYSIDLLIKNLAKLKEARSVTIVIEACFSGNSPGGTLIRSASGIYIKAKVPDVQGGVTILTAAQGDQLASWDNKAQHGLFTDRFLEGAYGDADLDDDGKVSVEEIRSYLNKEVAKTARRSFGRTQRPDIRGHDKMTISKYKNSGVVRPAPHRVRMEASPSDKQNEVRETLVDVGRNKNFRCSLVGGKHNVGGRNGGAFAKLSSGNFIGVIESITMTPIATRFFFEENGRMAGMYGYFDADNNKCDYGNLFQIRLLKSSRVDGCTKSVSDFETDNRRLEARTQYRPDLTGVMGAAGKAKVNRVEQQTARTAFTKDHDTICLTGKWQDSYGIGDFEFSFNQTYDYFSGFYWAPGEELQKAVWNGNTIN
jgi:hypothetical protein